MLPFKPGFVRLENDKIYVKSPTGTQELDIAPIGKAVPYYKNFRRNLNLGVIQRWPVDIIRRFIYDFKPQVDEYVSRPNRTTQSNLTMRIDMIIGKAIEPPRQ